MRGGGHEIAPKPQTDFRRPPRCDCVRPCRVYTKSIQPIASLRLIFIEAEIQAWIEKAPGVHLENIKKGD